MMELKMGGPPRIIGLLGGMSWPSTITYYREINKAVQARLGGSHSARLLVWSDDYHTVEQMQLNGEWEAAGRWLAASAQRLEAGGVDLLGIACNTMHKVADFIRQRTALPLVDIMEVTALSAGGMGCNCTAILGTRFTMEMGRYPEYFARCNIDSLLPCAEDRDALDSIIYRELCLGTINPESHQAIEDIVSRLVAAGADSVVLACTELNLLVTESQLLGARVIDATQAHIDALVEASLNDTSPQGESLGY